MNIMRKLLFAVICILAFGLNGNAQTEINNELKFTAQQEAQYTAIQQERANAIKALSSTRTENPAEYRAKLKEIITKSDDKMKAMMNEKQWEAYSRVQRQVVKPFNPR